MITKREFLFFTVVIIILSIWLGIMIDRMWRDNDIHPDPGGVSGVATYGNVVEWELGDEIVPFPFIDGKRLDCDDATLYSYLWLDGLPDLKVQPMYGVLNWLENGVWVRRAHTWLEVSDNETTMIYDYGTALPEDFYKGRRISYYQLLIYATNDFN